MQKNLKKRKSKKGKIAVGLPLQPFNNPIHAYTKSSFFLFKSKTSPKNQTLSLFYYSQQKIDMRKNSNQNIHICM